MSLSTLTGTYSIHSTYPVQWSVSQLPNGYYHIAVDGYKVISNSSKLIWAIPEPYASPPTEWELQSVPQHGTNAHLIIERGSPWGAWMISDSPGGQVQVTQTIASTPSIPPLFQPNIVLHLDRLD
ncbi:hypothetical protein D9611_006742 [Ephemerocybe angulata]|uniref:Uncharacterized protein n=1 Tax=Ephemerocybe angulata TaxID=980116 RepID=A0A8H5C8G8_9AGAR|nr:hypothetical protein D9611_006742 [Tulosesus angulatus]